MIRVDYIFYVEKYHGRLIDDEESLKLPVLKANTYLNQVLRRKPQGEEVEQIQFCLCEAAELIYQDDINRWEHGGREVQSESTDGYSVTYAVKGLSLIHIWESRDKIQFRRDPGGLSDCIRSIRFRRRAT